MNAISTASAGVLSGLAQFDSTSSAVIKSVGDQTNANTAGAIVDQMTAAQQVKASIATLNVSDQMLKQLLDIKV